MGELLLQAELDRSSKTLDGLLERGLRSDRREHRLQRGDLYEPVLKTHQSLAKALAQLQ